jgi:preprotein translocase subunit SecY
MLPGIDATQLTSLAGQTKVVLIYFRYSIGEILKKVSFCSRIMPYISASIVVQLMGIAIPSTKITKEDGESVEKRLNQITRWLTIVITLLTNIHP